MNWKTPLMSGTDFGGTSVPLNAVPETKPAVLVRRVDPPYPPLAHQARIKGSVTFSALIGKDGRVQNLQLINGHPLLAGC